MPKQFVDVTKKPGYTPYHKDRKWQRDLMTIRVPYLPNDGEPQVISTGIDGVHYHIPRGQDVRVPKLIVEMLQTRMQHHWAMPAKHPHQGLKYVGKQPRFYIIELEGAKAEKAVEIKPALPLAAEQRVAVEQELMAGIHEDIAAREEIARAPIHADLEG